VDASARPAAPFVLGITVAGDGRFVEIARQISERTAEFIGCRKPEASGIASAVERVIRGVREHAFQGEVHRSIEVVFAARDLEMEVTIRYRGRSAGVLERELRDEGFPGFQAAAPGADRVEFGRDNDHEFLTLTHSLPDGDAS
jgi:hypothetical protein